LALKNYENIVEKLIFKTPYTKKHTVLTRKLIKNRLVCIMQSIRETIHRKIYIGLLILLVIAMPFSEFLMSSAQIFLAANFFAEGKLLHKIRILKQRKSILIFVSIIFIHAIWIFNSNNLDYAIHDLRIKLPLLILPIIIGTSDLISKKELKLILLFFISSVFAASIYSVFVYLGLTHHKIIDYRGISVFISHIRFSLMINLSIFIIAYYYNKIQEGYKYLLITLIPWFIVYLFILHSLTGLLIFSITSSIILIKLIILKSNKLIKISTLSFILISIIISIYWFNNSFKRYNKIDNVNYSKLDLHTVNGNKYNHDSALTQTENGHFIYVNRCEKELKKEWNTISKINYDSLDLHGNKLKYTLIRYLTSLNLRKDSAGVHLLNKNDIEQIEKGIPNYIYQNKFSLYAIFYKTMWELDNYKETKNPNKNSLAQRIEYFNAGINIFKSNIWLGIGTGDVQDEFNNYYEKTNSSLTKKYRLRAHNQFLTLLLTFGLIGFSLMIFAFAFPIIYEKKLQKEILFIILIINFLSWLNEDSIETQPGITFFTFFIVLFIFGYKQDKDI